jgi:hypothetical protein
MRPGHLQVMTFLDQGSSVSVVGGTWLIDKFEVGATAMEWLICFVRA